MQIPRLLLPILCAHLLLSPAVALGMPQPAFQPSVTPAPLPRAKVVFVENGEATSNFAPNRPVLRRMLDQGLEELTGKASAAEAWRSLFSSEDIIGIKVLSTPGAIAGTRPSTVEALIEALTSAGIAPGQILIWDRRLADLRQAGYRAIAERTGAGLAGSVDAGFDPAVSYEAPLLGKLVWGDLEFDKHGEGIGRKSFVTTLLTRRITKVIHVTPLLNHNVAGVCGNLYSLALGSVDNTLRFESNPARLAEAVPEIYAMAEIGDRVALNIVDALLCQYEGEERTLLQYSRVLNQLRLSLDPIALDALSLQELAFQRREAGLKVHKPLLDLYSNAALLRLGAFDLGRIQLISLGPSRTQK